MKLNRVLLVSAPLDDDVGRREAVNSRCFPPLGLLRVASRLRRELPGIDVLLLDGDVVGLQAVRCEIETFRPDVVGVSALTPGYRSALDIARHAKGCGTAHVVFGNDHASFFPEVILRRRPEVSFIITGDSGERDFVRLIRALCDGGDPFETVANLWGVAGGAVRASRPGAGGPAAASHPLGAWADPGLLGEPHLASYREAYTRRFAKFHGSRPVSAFLVNNAKGCYKASDRCFYCSIHDLTVQAGKAADFWSLLERYRAEYGYNFFFEVCDNFGGLKSYRRSLVETTPGWFADSDVELMVYADALRISREPGLLDDFERLRVRRVNIGFDSGDAASLRSLKGFRHADVNRAAMSMLGERGIQIHSSFVLGALGENEETVANTVSLIEDAIADPTVVAIEVSPLFPMPGSPAWGLFLGEAGPGASRLKLEGFMDALGRSPHQLESVWEQTRAHFSGNDVIDLTLASRLWADNFTALGHGPLRELVAELNRRIEGAGKITGGFG